MKFPVFFSRLPVWTAQWQACDPRRYSKQLPHSDKEQWMFKECQGTTTVGTCWHWQDGRHDDMTTVTWWHDVTSINDSMMTWCHWCQMSNMQSKGLSLPLQESGMMETEPVRPEGLNLSVQTWVWLQCAVSFLDRLQPHHSQHHVFAFPVRPFPVLLLLFFLLFCSLLLLLQSFLFCCECFALKHLCLCQCLGSSSPFCCCTLQRRTKGTHLL